MSISATDEGLTLGNEFGKIHTLKGMYENYFLDYASYVILERAVPSIEDGLKPVQRRILFAMKKMDDGRYHKVANIIGQTMQYHPHGDAAIGDALVKLGQRNLLIDTQGNWGDTRTGDSAAASRYIEARLTKFALDVVFNNDTTEWQISYDGRKNEPINLPVKFPLLLAQGVEGIAVGLSTKILPHNIGELIRASIKILEDKRISLYPDFETGGFIDVANYNNGKRGGKILIRAKIEKKDKNQLVVRELPFGVTTSSLIESIIKANDKGKIKIKKVVDNTAKDVEVLIDLMPGVSPDLTIDALYAFTHCSISVSPNACVIIDNKPHFLAVNEILRLSTENTKQLLKLELEIKQRETEEKWHFASLEKIFIEKRVYREIEECETWESVIETIDREMRKYIRTPEDKKSEGDKRLLLARTFTEEDIVRLTEIKIKRISKYNAFKADSFIKTLEETLIEVAHNLENLNDFAIAYFEDLYEKYGKNQPRRTIIQSFEEIDLVEVAANNVKLYVNQKEGFIGWGMKKDEFVRDCSDLDDIIAFKKDGTFRVSRIGEKVFMGKNILHTDVWKKGDDRTTYNLIYLNGKTGRTLAKRFHVTAITRDKDYLLTKELKGSKVHYFSANPNGEAEVVQVQLSPGSKARNKVFQFDFATLDIKGRGSQGNIVTKYPVRKVQFVEAGKSTLGALKIWIDEVSGRINTEQRGTYLGEFNTGDHILAIYADGTYILHPPEPNLKVATQQLKHVGRHDLNTVIGAIYFEGSKGWTMVKRFKIETLKIQERFHFVSEHPRSKLVFATTEPNQKLVYSFMSKNKKVENELDLDAFIDVKGWKALGNKLTEKVVKQVRPLKKAKKTKKASSSEPLHPGDTIEFDLDPSNGQGSLFEE